MSALWLLDSSALRQACSQTCPSRNIEAATGKIAWSGVHRHLATSLFASCSGHSVRLKSRGQIVFEVFSSLLSERNPTSAILHDCNCFLAVDLQGPPPAPADHHHAAKRSALIAFRISLVQRRGACRCLSFHYSYGAAHRDRARYHDPGSPVLADRDLLVSGSRCCLRCRNHRAEVVVKPHDHLARQRFVYPGSTSTRGVEHIISIYQREKQAFFVGFCSHGSQQYYLQFSDQSGTETRSQLAVKRGPSPHRTQRFDVL